MKINKVRLGNSNLSVAIDYTDESGQEHLLILGAENVVENWQAVEQPLALDSATPDIKGGVLVTSVDGVIKNARVIPPTSKANRWAALAQRHKEKNMDCKKCGSPMYYPSPSKLCPQCEGEELDKWIAEQDAAQQSVQPTAAGGSDSGENLESGGG